MSTSTLTGMNIGTLDLIRESLDDGETLVVSVNGHCMDPIICDGDKVKVKKLPRYQTGDILACYSTSYPQGVAHRFLGYVRSPKRIRLITMPDRASRPDLLMKPGEVLGKIVSVNGIDIPEIAPLERIKHWFRWITWCIRLGFIRLGHALRSVG